MYVYTASSFFSFSSLFSIFSILLIAYRRSTWKCARIPKVGLRSQVKGSSDGLNKISHSVDFLGQGFLLYTSLFAQKEQQAGEQTIKATTNY